MSDGIDDRDAALHNLELGQAWVGNADTKIGLATAALALLTGAFVGRINLVVHAFTASPWLGAAVLAGTFVVLGLLARAGWHLLQALLPTTQAHEPNRFAWPTLTELADAEIEQPVNAEILRIHAWQQARCLASITNRKYQHFYAGAKWLAAAFAALALWLIFALIAVSVTETTSEAREHSSPTGKSDPASPPSR